MAIISCPECGRQVSEHALSCPDCGYPINKNSAVASNISNEEEISKLIVLARRAREGSDGQNAQKYYNQILDKDPGNWEAIFYSVYFEASACKIRDISSAANYVANCMFSTFSAIADLNDEQEKNEAIFTVCSSATAIASMFVSGAVNHYNQFSTTSNAFSECSGRVVSAGNIFAEIESSYKKVFPDKKAELVAHQKKYMEFVKLNSRWYDVSFRNNLFNRIDNEIAQVYPKYGKRRELEKKIESLNLQIASIQTEKKPKSAFGGYFFLVVGAIMLVLGLMLMSLDGGSWPILVAIPELIIAAFFFKKTPSDAVIEENKIKKQRMIEERTELQNELNSL